MSALRFRSRSFATYVLVESLRINEDLAEWFPFCRLAGSVYNNLCSFIVDLVDDPLDILLKLHLVELLDTLIINGDTADLLSICALGSSLGYVKGFALRPVSSKRLSRYYCRLSSGVN